MSEQRFFEQLFDSIAERGREFLNQAVGAQTKPVDALPILCHQLLDQKGEATAAALAQRTVAAYRKLDDVARLAFFTFLAEELNPDPSRVMAAAKAYQAAPSPETLKALSLTSEAPRQELFRRMNMAPDGTATLVDLRAHLLNVIRTHPALGAVDQDMLHLFGSWFNRGFLMLQQIDWRTPAFLLEKLIAYESVHAIQGWEDLRRRLADDRRCFAFFHPVLADEPLIFVEVALVNGMAEKVQPLLDQAEEPIDPLHADTAIFYSINNCQKGLRGVSFGNFLIKQVAAELKEELPNLKTFATLSPVPGFRRWLSSLGGTETSASDSAGQQDALTLDGQEILAHLEPQHETLDPEADKRVRLPLTRLCAHYLTMAKRKDGRPLDPVARFHLGNGARLERVNWAGDVSANGMRQSAGIMVNYLYKLDQLERNHEAYVNRRQVVASRSVEQLAKGGQALLDGGSA